MRGWAELGMAVLLGGACVGATPAAPSIPRAVAQPRPAACQEVPAGARLQGLLDQAVANAALCLAPGEYDGPLRLDRGLTLWGPKEARIRSRGDGTTVRLTEGARLLGT